MLNLFRTKETITIRNIKNVHDNKLTHKLNKKQMDIVNNIYKRHNLKFS